MEVKQKIESFEDLHVYRLAREIRKKVREFTTKLPPDEKYILAGQMRRAALSITNNIAEGFGRYHYQENIQYCRQSRGSAYELLDDLNDCYDAGYISEGEMAECKSDIYTFIKVLNCYVASIRKVKEIKKVTD